MEKELKIGVVFPQTEFGSDPSAIRDYAQTAEGLGFSHVLAYEHVLGVNPQRPGGWDGLYDYTSAFFEPFVLFSYMAAVTYDLGFVSGIMVLPLRQTALVAKQAASLDLLSRGRLRLGVGVGWNEVEYRSLGEDFNQRGRRIEEQVEVLRKLWCCPLVDYEGEFHRIPDAGINPLPLQKPIPIWFGGHAEAVLQRTARLGDGWLPNYPSAAEARPSIEKLKKYLEENGRSPLEFGIEARMSFGKGKADSWQKTIQEWKEIGATHLSLNTMRLGFSRASEHINALKTFAAAILDR